MQIIDIPTGEPVAKAAAVALGLFDGLHIGHAAVIGRALEQQKNGLFPTVFTFSTQLSQPDGKTGGALLTPAAKATLLESWGIQLLLTPDFSEIMTMEPETFVRQVLAQRLGAQMVCCGEDFRFGRAAAAGTDDLRRLCAAQGIAVETLGDVSRDGRRVSSSWVRELLEAGETEQAAMLLGRAFGFGLPVVEGKKLGRTIDFPTINQPIPDWFVRLRQGVYVSLAFAAGVWHPAVTNIGCRPTVEKGGIENAETYLLDFSGNLYGQTVEVRLLCFLRSEEKFDSIAALRTQISADAVAAGVIAQKYLEKCGDMYLQTRFPMI